MKNFVFLSPNFPEAYWQFCHHLKNNGMRVLGIGDCPYDQLRQELRDCLTDYYKVSDLANYEEVYRAVAFLIFRYGRIDWLESNNEFWLERDAKLRTEFNITTGFKTEDMEKMKHKSAMKEYYAKAGIPTCRWHLAHEYEAAKAFAHEVGYPVVVKPDNGVGAISTYKLKSDADLDYFFATKDDNVYIMEEFVNGEVRTFDAIINSKGEPIFETGNVTVGSIMDIVNDADNSMFYIVKELSPKMRDFGRRTVEAFGVKSRFVHLEYFVLREDKEGLGKKDDIVGLEVNMRPSGGVSPDMMNFANELDVYKIWADMIAFDESTMDMSRPHHFAGFCGRRDGKNFVMDHDAIMAKYGHCMKMAERVPEALSGAMANMMYLATFDTEEELFDYYRDLTAVHA